jgi:membrane-bound lytic murein transglycosylase B
MLTANAAEKDEAAFSAYVEALKKESIEAGFDETFIADVFPDIAYRPSVVKADKNQPETKITLDTYLASRVPDWKVKQGVALAQEYGPLLKEIGRQYGVQPRFILALWGNESNFGKLQGNYSVLSALASLAFEGRREDMFKKQFFAALTILSEKHIEPEQFKGSWAGAMGQSQFMPTSFLHYAVDYNGDGKKDIWHTPADVFASIANFLSSEGWQDDATWGRQVSVLGEVTKLPSGLKKSAYFPLSYWQNHGVRRYDGSDLPDTVINASLLMPDGPKGRIYLVYSNFHTLMKWNRSSYFGISVSYLSERIKRGY